MGSRAATCTASIDHLDHLRDLGVTALYLNPVFASASNHRYHTYDYYTVDPLLGGNDALRALLDAAHAAGMKVILDGVFNHASRGFWPFNHVLECGIGSPYVDWFYVDRDALAAGRPLRAYPNEPLRHASEDAGGPDHFGSESISSLGYRAWWDLPALPKLNTDNPQVREYLFDVAEHWIRFGADGWRLDVAAEIDDDDFWREFRRRVKAIDPEAYIVAEIWHEDHRWLHGDQFDAYMNYPVGFAALSFCAGSHRDERVIRQHGEVGANVRHDDGATFLDRLGRALSFYDPEINAVQMNCLGTHDTPRLLSMCAGDTDGMRLTELVLLTVGGAPNIYYGDEVGMSGEHDPACRGAFPWDRPETWDRGLHAFYRGAIALRHAHPALRRGTFTEAGAAGMTAAYLRRDDADAFVICINAGDGPAWLDLHLPDLDGRTLEPVTWEGWSWGGGEAVTVAGGSAAVDLPARGARVLRAR